MATYTKEALAAISEEYIRGLDLAVKFGEGLPQEIIDLATQSAISNHEGWMADKAAKGYVYGEKVNNDPAKGPLTDPDMLPFDELSPEVRQKNLDNALGVFQILQSRGFGFMSKHDLCRKIAEQIHDNWCKIQVANGFVFGEITDKAQKVHRDLLPFNVLEKVYPADISYDMSVAEAVLERLWKAGYILVGFMA